MKTDERNKLDWVRDTRYSHKMQNNLTGFKNVREKQKW